MFELTHKHLELITADVNRADISFSHLKYDIIDHICCDLENEMNHGVPFEKAYEMVKARIGIRGLQQIQEDTLFLIDKKYRIMKNSMKIFGVISTVLLAFGALFKIEHWPGAGIMITLGFFLLCVVFLPSAVYVSYREVSNRTRLFTHLTGFLSAFLFSVSFLFKIQHWPGAGILMMVASMICGLFFIPTFFIARLKESGSSQLKVASIFGLFGSWFYLFGFLFKMNHWPGALIMLLLGSVLLIGVAFPVFIVSHYKEYRQLSSRFVFMTFAVVWFVVPTFLMSMNVSEDTYKGLRETESQTETNIDFLLAKNQKLFNSIKTDGSQDALKIRETATSTVKQSEKIYDYIQNIKGKLIRINLVDSTIRDNQVTIEKIKYREQGEVGISEYLLVEKNEASLITRKLEDYKTVMLQTINDDKIASDQIASILTAATVRPSSLISTVNQLSMIQERVLMAEMIVLSKLSVQSGQKLLLVKNQ
jgi:hypothetical protein